MMMSAISIVLMVSANIYLAKIFYDSKDIENFESNIRGVDTYSLINTYGGVAFGSSLAWYLILKMPYISTWAFVFFFQNDGLENVTIMIIEIFIIFLGVISIYLFPLIHIDVIKSNNLNGGFIATMKFFSPKIWKQAFNINYFKLIMPFFIIGLIFIFLLPIMITFLESSLNIFIISFAIIFIVNILQVFFFILIISLLVIIFHPKSQDNLKNNLIPPQISYLTLLFYPNHHNSDY